MNHTPSSRTDQTRTTQTAHRGFTLVELVAALVIGSTIIAATLSMLQTATKYGKLAKADAQLQPALTLLAEQIERDFINARAFRSGPGSIQLAGFMGRASSSSSLEPAVVTYEIRRVGGRGVLFRSELHPMAKSSNATSEPVLNDTYGFDVLIDVEDEASTTQFPFANGMQPMPQSMQIFISDESGGVILQKHILHHRGID